MKILRKLSLLSTVPLAGVVYAPAFGELFYAAQGLGAWMRISDGREQVLQVAPWVPTQPLCVIGSRSHGADKLACWLPTLGCRHSFVAAGSSLKFCRIAQGQADVYPLFGPTSQWDTAAAQCVLVSAGGAVRDMAGEPLRYGFKYPLLNPEFLAVGGQAIALAMYRAKRMPIVRIVSFIIPLFNHVAHSQAMLASLLATMPAGLEHEIILIDDCSTDGTRAWLATLDDPHIKTLLNPHNLGYAKTNNRAASVASGDVLALLNNDLLFEPGWLEPMLHTLLSPTLNTGPVGNVQYRVADGTLDHAGVRLNPHAQFGHIQTLADNAPVHTKALAVTGACMLLRKADFDALGDFDEQFVDGCEDIDLCFKLRAAGKAIVVANTSRIRHHVNLSRDVNTLHNERNSRHLFGRWRKLIKQELAAQWATLLQAGPHAYAGLLSGHLVPAFVATSQAAARVIAEAMLMLKEYHWARNLGEPDPQCWRGRPLLCAWSGLQARSKWLCNVAKRRVCIYRLVQRTQLLCVRPYHG